MVLLALLTISTQRVYESIIWEVHITLKAWVETWTDSSLGYQSSNCCYILWSFHLQYCLDLTRVRFHLLQVWAHGQWKGFQNTWVLSLLSFRFLYRHRSNSFSMVASRSFTASFMVEPWPVIRISQAISLMRLKSLWWCVAVGSKRLSW